MQFLFVLFILVPIIEIGVFIQVGGLIGPAMTILIVFVTAIIGVNLLKQQGLRSWSEIQMKMANGQVPALEVASAAQLLFAGGLLLTPGFVTDAIGFSLMLPAVRSFIALKLIGRWQLKSNVFSQNPPSGPSFQTENDSARTSTATAKPKNKSSHRIIEGEFEDQSK